MIGMGSAESLRGGGLGAMLVALIEGLVKRQKIRQWMILNQELIVKINTINNNTLQTK